MLPWWRSEIQTLIVQRRWIFLIQDPRSEGGLEGGLEGGGGGV